MLTNTVNILFFSLLAVYTGFTRFTQPKYSSKSHNRSALTGLLGTRRYVTPLPSNIEILSDEVYMVNTDYITKYCLVPCIHMAIVLNDQRFRAIPHELFPEKPSLCYSKTKFKPGIKSTDNPITKSEKIGLYFMHIILIINLFTKRTLYKHFQIKTMLNFK